MSRPRVLVIDDDPLFRSLLLSMLRRDYLVSVASDGAEGYYKALEHVPHLAIIDVQMPGWDGLRTLQAMRTQHALARVPVMMLTSDSSRQTVVAAIEAGANDYVIKTTLSRDELLKKTQRLISLGVAMPENGTGSVPDAGAADVPVGPLPTAIPEAPLPAVADLASRPHHHLTNDSTSLQAIIDNWD